MLAPTRGASGKFSGRATQRVAASYGLFFVCAWIVFNVFTSNLSSLLTFAAGLQTLGFLLLMLKVKGESNISGISAKMLGVYSLMFAFRLSSTLTHHGYLPADATGDGAFQCGEMFSLLLVLLLLSQVLHTRRTTFACQHQDQDSMRAWPLLLVCGILAMSFYSDMNDDPIFDMIWAFACYLETVAILPQLWMMSKAGGEVEALTGHFIALTTLARVCSAYFWYLVFEEDIFVHGRYSEMMLLGAHLLQVLFSLDFLVLYAKSFGKRVRLGDDAVRSQWL